jgi:apolipoprotein N-acyltransferase
MRYILEKGIGRRSLPRAFALAAVSAALMALAVPNELFKHGLAGLGFIALVPLYFAVLEAGSPRASAFVVGLFGSLQHALSSFWLWFFQDFRFWTLGSTTIAYFVVYMVLGLYLWLFLCRSGRARPAAFAILWASFEYLKSNGFLGYPWALLPYSLTDALPLLQIADLAGVYGISFVLAAANAALAELALGIGSWRLGAEAPGAGLPGFGSPMPAALSPRARIAYAGLALALSALSLGYGLSRLAAPIPLVGSIDAVLVQQDTDPWVGSEEEGLMANIRLARQAMEGGAGTGAAETPGGKRAPDIVLFSETSLTRPYAEFRKYYSKHPSTDPLVPFIKGSGIWLFTGAPVVVDWHTGDATNSVILIDPSGDLVGSYAKIHPVPFAEAIPFWEFAPFRKFIQNAVGLESGWVMGTEYAVFELPTKGGTFRFGAPICFEDAFAGVCRNFFLKDADLLVNLTDVSWSKTDSAEIQHWAAARFRAIEARRTLVRSTNGGLSCVVGPYGQVIASLPLFTAASLRCEVPVYREASPTLYIRFGDWFARSALLLSAVLFIILGVGEGNKRRKA